MRRSEEPPVQDAICIEKPIDKRSAMVDRKAAPKQVLCYVCCAEFGTNSLPIHLKTCLKKHDWGLSSIANDETVTRKTAAQNRKKCVVPGEPPSTPLPSAKSPPEKFELYNEEAQRIFYAHAHHCLWCRTQNVEAMEAVRKAEEDAMRLQKLRGEEEARKKAFEDEEARRRAEQAVRKKLVEDEARKRAQEEVAKWLGNEEEKRRKALESTEAANRRATEEEARRLALEEEEAEAEERRKRLLAQGKHKFLRKGEGIQAATESGHVHEKAKLEEKAKQDIAYYSLNHAKKEGLVSDKPILAPKVPDVTFKEIEIDETEWKKEWSPDAEVKFSMTRAEGLADKND